MSQRHPVHTIISHMEVDVADVRRWGDLLYHLAASPNSIDAGTLHVIAAPILALGERLEARWGEAFRIAGGQP